MQKVLTILPFLGFIWNYEMMYEKTNNMTDRSFQTYLSQTSKASGEKNEIEIA